MARNLQIAVQAKFSAAPLLWTVGRAEYVGWVDPYYFAPHAVVHVLEPRQYAGLLQGVNPDELPREIAAKVPPVSPRKKVPPVSRPGGVPTKVYEDSHPLKFEILISDLPGDRKKSSPIRKKFDAWLMRDEFLRLDRDSGALASFLGRYGDWGAQTIPTFRMETLETDPQVVFPDKIWYVGDLRKPKTNLKPVTERIEKVPLQDIVRWGRTCEASEWFASDYPKITLEGPGPRFPHYVIEPTDCFAALFATITIDRLTGVQSRVCANPDCRSVFTLESKHHRLYCCQYCAHLESVRRSRRAQKVK